MQINSAQFIKGLTQIDEVVDDGLPHIAFIGRSNVGKSSLINALTQRKDLARTSSFPGRTQQINQFLINKAFYLVDLPGYGFANLSSEARNELRELTDWYLFGSAYRQQAVVLILDAEVGPTPEDRDMLYRLAEHGKNFIVVANKIDKIRPAEHDACLQAIYDIAGAQQVVPCSTRTGAGIGDLVSRILRSVSAHKTVRRTAILGGRQIGRTALKRVKKAKSKQQESDENVDAENT